MFPTRSGYPYSHWPESGRRTSGGRSLETTGESLRSLTRRSVVPAGRLGGLRVRVMRVEDETPHVLLGRCVDDCSGEPRVFETAQHGAIPTTLTDNHIARWDSQPGL